MEHLTEFVTNNLILFAALLGVLVMLIKAELDHQSSKGTLVSPSQAIRLMNNDEKGLVLDVRSATDFKNGHIKGAKNLPVGEFAAAVSNYKDYKNNAVLLYCNSGTNASRVIKLLKNAGFENVSNLQGGIVAWKEANMPLVKK